MKAVKAFQTRRSLLNAAAARIGDALKEGIFERGEGLAALSGGATPEPAYAELATLPLDWPRVAFALVDERFVPGDDFGSNEAMLRRALGPALAAGAKLLPMYAAGVSLDAAAERANSLYAEKPIDIALMGMGGDGHTASWFSQSPELQSVLALDNPRTVLAVTAPGAAGSAERLTLTRSALARAKAIALLITGAEKRTLLLDERRSFLPVDALFDLSARVETSWAP